MPLKIDELVIKLGGKDGVYSMFEDLGVIMPKKNSIKLVTLI